MYGRGLRLPASLEFMLSSSSDPRSSRRRLVYKPWGHLCMAVRHELRDSSPAVPQFSHGFNCRLGSLREPGTSDCAPRSVLHATGCVGLLWIRVQHRFGTCVQYLRFLAKSVYGVPFPHTVFVSDWCRED